MDRCEHFSLQHQSCPYLFYPHVLFLILFGKDKPSPKKKQPMSFLFWPLMQFLLKWLYFCFLRSDFWVPELNYICMVSLGVPHSGLWSSVSWLNPLWLWAILPLCFYFFFKKKCPLHNVLVRVKWDNTYKAVKHLNNAGHKWTYIVIIINYL